MKKKFYSVGCTLTFLNENISRFQKQGEVVYNMKSYFFVGCNSFHGKEEEMEFMLGNFQRKNIIPENFKLVNYILQNKISKTRLYLLTKKKKKRRRARRKRRR